MVKQFDLSCRGKTLIGMRIAEIFKGHGKTPYNGTVTRYCKINDLYFIKYDDEDIMPSALYMKTTVPYQYSTQNDCTGI